MPISHWMTFSTFAEQRFFIYPTPETYSGVVLNANMVAHAPDGIAAFLLERTANNSYLIDPLTHAFQHDPIYILNSNGEPKSSVAKLADAYGRPVSAIVGKRPALPKDFSNEEELSVFVKNVIEFEERLSHVMANTEANKKYLNAQQTQLMPQAIVAPYFFLSETTYEEWLPVVMKCISTSRNLRPNTTLFAEIVIDRGVLVSPVARKAIVDAFSAAPVNGFLLWVDQFDEQDTTEDELASFLDLCRKLRGNTDRVLINLHGGYFSILAGSAAGGGILTGVAHGPEFGESRGVIPVGGGLPFAKYYIPKLHARFKYRDAQRIFLQMNWLSSAQTFHSNVCDCQACVDAIGGDSGNFVKFGESVLKRFARGRRVVSIEFPTNDAKELCLKHYLQRKSREFYFCSNANKQQLLSDLESSAQLFEGLIGKDGVGPLRQWVRVLSG